jgi:hypothetical protein
MKFSSTGLLLISLVMTGSTWSGPVAKQTAPAAVRSHGETVRLNIPVGRPPAVIAAPIVSPRSVSGVDVWLTVLLGGGMIALQLRRTQMSVRRARVMV